MTRRPWNRVVAVAAALAAPAGWAQSQDGPAAAPPAELVRELQDLGALSETAEQYDIEIWTKRRLDAEAIYRLGENYIVQEKGTGELFLAWQQEPGKLEGGWQDLREFVRGSSYPALPVAPKGWQLREAFRLPEQPVRLTTITGSDGARFVFALCMNGSVYRWNAASGNGAELYIDGDTLVSQIPGGGQLLAQGLCIDNQRRLYAVLNREDRSATPSLNRVTIFRSEPIDDPAAPAPGLSPWLEVSYPYGVGGYNHGVGHIAQGPDGMIYVGSGSRTDADEPGEHRNRSTEGEVELTSSIWRLDPAVPKNPLIETFADGLRNPFGFTWDAQGRMWCTDNGPNEDPPEELNLIEEGKHYGFPYAFSDWSENPYRNVEAPPQGLAFVPPVQNVGPDAGGSAERPIATFDPHSSPAGIVQLDDTFPESVRGTFLVARFGNLLDAPGGSVGFDLLNVRIEEREGGFNAHVTRLLHPLARPIDVIIAGPGTAYICEHNRATQFRRRWAPGDLPGRVLELKAVE